MKKRANKEDSIHLNDYLKALRLAAGYTQQDIADVLYINRSSYSYIESGKSKPKLDYLKKLAHLYGVDISVFFYGSDKPATSSQRNRAPKRGESRPEKINGLTDKERNLIVMVRSRGDTYIDEMLRYIKRDPTKSGSVVGSRKDN